MHMLKFDGSLTRKERFTAWFLFFSVEPIAKISLASSGIIVLGLYPAKDIPLVFYLLLGLVLLALYPWWWRFLMIFIFSLYQISGEKWIIELADDSILISIMNKTELVWIIRREQIVIFKEKKDYLYIRTKDKFGFYINLKKLSPPERNIIRNYCNN